MESDRAAGLGAAAVEPLSAALRDADPVVIVEVLSPSTEAEDRGVKLPAYRRLASVRDILLVASDGPAVEHYVRQGEQWTIADRGPGETVTRTIDPGARVPTWVLTLTLRQVVPERARAAT